MIFWNSPFNKVVRSHEAGFVGLLAGIIIGVLLMVNVHVTVEQEVAQGAIKICGSIDNIDTISYNYSGKIEKLSCKDGRIFTDF